METDGGWRRLAAAILVRAAKDAQSRDGYAAEARYWLLSSPWAIYLMDMMELDRSLVRRWVLDLKPLRQPALPL
jgi:hypothetical protein